MRSKIRKVLEKIADDCDMNTMTREELIKAEECVEFDIGVVVGLRRAIAMMEENEDDKRY
jgi:hypothetical protein